MPDTKQHRFLFVDDDQPFLDAMSELFASWSHGQWQTHTASTAALALQTLSQHPIDVVVLDIKMPVMDGLQFLQLLNRKYPATRKIVLTGQTDDTLRQQCLDEGVELYLEKPRAREGFQTVFVSLNELANLQPKQGFSGILRQAGLQDIIQMECIARNSSILQITNGNIRGRIYIEKGKIIHAEQANTTGETAFNHLLSQPGGEFKLLPYAPPSATTIDGQWEFLVMEAARLRDEASQNTETPPAESLSEPVPETITSLPEEDFPAGIQTKVQEFVIASNQGEILYEWQSPDPAKRIQLFQHIAAHALTLSQNLPLGRFERLEALGPGERAVIHLAPDRNLFVRTAQRSAEPPQAPNE
jgi:CheY-like chemotaxis protein